MSQKETRKTKFPLLTYYSFVTSVYACNTIYSSYKQRSLHMSPDQSTFSSSSKPRKPWKRAALGALVVSCAGVGLLGFGNQTGVFGPTSSMKHLLDEKLAQPSELGISTEKYSHSPRPGLFEKAAPEDVTYEFLTTSNDVDFLALKEIARHDGWVDDTSAGGINTWYANKTTATKPTVRLSITKISYRIVVKLSYY